MSELTRLAHSNLSPHLKPGDVAVDLTAGNGHDTWFLAQQVAPDGRVYAFDIQSRAVEATRARFRDGLLEKVVRVLHESHNSWEKHLEPSDLNRLRVVMMNLGYLPGGDVSITTDTSTSLTAAKSALARLMPGGVLSILAYTGHPGGLDEAMAIKEWLIEQQSLGFVELEQHPVVPNDGAPFLMIAHKQ